MIASMLLITLLTIGHLNQVPTPTPASSPPSALCHHPSGTSTDSPGLNVKLQAPSILNALSKFSFAFSNTLGGISSHFEAPESGENSADTGRGIVDVLPCLGSVDGSSRVDDDGGRT